MRTALTLALAAISLASTDAAAQSHAIRQVCLTYDQGAQELVASLRTRCLGSGARETSNTLALAVENERARIVISGEYETRRTFNIGSADCMATQSFDLTASHVDERRYAFFFGDQKLGVFDATQALADARCYALQSAAQSHLSERDFRDWSPLEDNGLSGQPAPQVGDILARMMGNEPETLEGRPEAHITMERVRWLPSIVSKPAPSARQGHDAMAVHLTRHGLLDDSVSGERMSVILRHDEDGWIVYRSYRQTMCARGTTAGQWSSATCP